MHTYYDWATLACFCALVTLFLHRSTGAPVQGDRTLAYLPPALGCAATNWLGNEGHDAAAILVLIASIGYVLIVLKPGAGRR